MRTIASMVRKRDITAFWELDPLAAPPKSMQNQLRGALVAEPDLHEEDGEEWLVQAKAEGVQVKVLIT